MKFRSTAQFVATLALGALLAVNAPSARAAVQTYEMTVAPDAESPAMTKVEDGFGDSAAGDLGPPLNAGLQGDGAARFVDTGDNGFDGYYINGIGSTYTIDMKVKANQTVLPSSGNDVRSMGFHDGGTDGADQRGLRIEPGALTLVNGSGPVSGGTASVDLTTCHRIRIVIDAGQVTIYDLENDLDAGAGFNWAVLAGPVSLGGSGAGFGVAGADTTGGAVHINSFASTTTTRSDFNLDWLRIDTNTNRGATTDIIPGAAETTPASCLPPACITTVTPNTTQTRTGFEFGITPTPADVVYTLNNTGQSTVTYTVSEVDAVGAALDYNWLSLTSGSTVSPGGNHAVNASIDTTSLAAGSQTGYIKWSDGCPAAAACMTEPFTYTNSGLVGNDGWTGSAQAGDIDVLSNEIKISADNGGDASDVNAIRNVSCSPDGDGVISVKFKARLGSGSDFIWDIQAFDASNAGGNLMAWIRGRGDLVRARTPLSGSFGDFSLVAGFTEIEMRIHTASDKTQFFAGGSSTPFATLDYSPGGNSVGSVRLVRLPRDDTVGTHVFLDDLSVSVLEQHVRRIDLQVIGGAIQVDAPALLSVGPCNGANTTQHTFTVRNIGAYDWTSYYAVDDFANPWITLSPNVGNPGGAVPRGETRTITATVNWSQVAGNDTARIRFHGLFTDHNSTPNVDISTAPTLGANTNALNVFDPAALVKLVYQPQLGQVPSTANSAGGTNKFALYDGSSDQGAAVVSDLQASDGFAYRINDQTGAPPLAMTKWRAVDQFTNTIGTIIPDVGGTMVARVKTISTVSTRSANLMLLSSTIGAAYHWGGADGIAREVERGVDYSVTGDANYHTIRLTSQLRYGSYSSITTGVIGSANVVKLYLDETLLVPAIDPASNSNSGFDGLGFGTGSSSGAQDIYFDWVEGTNSGAFGPGEEVACIGSLIPPSICDLPRVDRDNDDDVDLDDFAEFQICYTGSLVSPPPLPPQCQCFDDGDSDIDVADFNYFMKCTPGGFNSRAEGATIKWVSTVDCPN